MKKIYLYMAGAALAALTASCSEENFNPTGEGKLVLSTTVSSDVEVVSRATEQELSDGCMIWISSEKGLVRRYNGLSEVPASIDLITGRYVAEAWTGDSVSASFDKRWFKGREEFTVEAGQTTQVNLSCKIANVVVSVVYDESIGNVLTDYSMNIGHSRASLTFGKDLDPATDKGYFMMPSTDTDLTYTINGTQLNGKPFEFAGKLEAVKPATEYVLNVKCSESSLETGGAIFTITVDERSVEVVKEIEVVAAPKFSGFGFDINEPLMGEAGSFGRQTVYIASATNITGVEITSDYLPTVISGMSTSTMSLFELSEVGKATAEVE